MKKVDNEIQKELSYNYHTAFEADRVINMTEYFDEPPKKSNPFAKLSPSICVVAFTAIVLMVSVLSIYLFNGRKILVNTKYEKNDHVYLEPICHCEFFKKYDNINEFPVFITNIEQRALIFIYNSNEKDGSTKIYYDYHLIGTSNPLVVTLTVNDNTYNINGDNSVGYIQTFEKNEDIKLNISIECNGKKSTFIIKK